MPAESELAERDEPRVHVSASALCLYKHVSVPPGGGRSPRVKGGRRVRAGLLSKLLLPVEHTATGREQGRPETHFRPAFV